MPTVDPDAFKAALGSWAAGVTAVTTRHDGLEYAITASSFSSLSLDPPLILVCIANGNTFETMVRDAKHFAVSILAQGQDDISNGFARSGRDPLPQLPDVETFAMETGSPHIKGAMAHLDCELEETLNGGDHVIVIGRVVAASADDSMAPLMYFRRDYRGLVLD